MAINVDTVYKTVLFLLNKEQRGYMTPEEFNNVASQVQLEIFDQYFEDLNQQLRVPQADVDYADRIAAIDEKISVFKRFQNPTYVANYFDLSVITDLYKIGTVVYNTPIGTPVELQRLPRSSFYNIQKSPLTAPTTTFPTYLYENNRLYVSPATINVGFTAATPGDISVDYVKKPSNPKWNFTVGGLGQYVFTSSAAGPPAIPSVDFELQSTEQTTVILKILIYAGLIIEDPTVIQVAAGQVQQQQQNSKS